MDTTIEVLRYGDDRARECDVAWRGTADVGGVVGTPVCLAIDQHGRDIACTWQGDAWEDLFGGEPCRDWEPAADGPPLDSDLRSRIDSALAGERKRGRPRATADGLRKGRNISFTDTEWARVVALAEDAGLKASEYIRARALRQRLRRPAE